jgi:hypothetical protein
VAYSQSFPAISFGLDPAVHDPHAPWRYTLMSGIIPAIPLIIIRPFLPESPVWAEKRAAGTLKRPSIAALFAPELRRTTIVTTIMFAMSYGAAFGALQQNPQIVPGLPEIRALIANATSPQEAGRIVQAAAAQMAQAQEIGGLLGRVLFALIAVYFVSRRKLIRVFQIPGLIVLPLVFGVFGTSNMTGLYWGTMLAGLLTIGQFSFWGNYLPSVYPVHLRGTGESFAANIGGRLVGTLFAAVTATLAITPDSAFAPHKVALVAAAVGFGVYLVGFIASFWLPEPKREELME